MHIQIAKTAGFCMGVRRAVDMAIDAANQRKGPICTYGPLIHNPQVLDILKEKGIPTLNHIPEKGEGCIIIRAHGVPPDTRERLERAGFTVMDATCPRVIKVQTIIRKHARSGHHVIIAGDEDHPEVQGLLGYAGNLGHVVDSLEKLSALPPFEKAIIVAQTTQNIGFYENVREWVRRTAPHYTVFDTICDSTEKRQAETLALAREVDLVLVLGGKNSGNTQRLAEVAEEAGTPSLHIESADEIEASVLEGKKRIGITAGASTPNWVLRQVVSTLNQLSTETDGRFRHLRAMQRFILSSNIYLASGAGALAYAASVLQGFSHNMNYSFIAAFYILSMQIFNTLTGIPSDRYNNPERAQLYEKRRLPFFILAGLTGLAGLGAALHMGLLPFLLLLFMSLAGVFYSTRLPASLFPSLGIRSMKEIPGSKTLLIALAWGVVCVLLPSLGVRGYLDTASLGAFFFIAILLFIRTAFFDILDMQGDRIAGKETLPILLGEEASHRLLNRLLTGLCLGLFMLVFLDVFRPAALLLVLPPFILIWMLGAEAESRIPSDTQLAFQIESLLILTGLLAGIARMVY